MIPTELLFSGISKLEIVASTIAIVFEPLDSPPSLKDQDLTALMRRPLALGQTVNGLLVVSSNRDQAEFHLGANKLDVRDLSGEIANAKTRIPSLLRQVYDLISNPPLRTIGFNFIIEFEVPDAQKVLADCLLKSDSVPPGTDLRSNSVSLVFQHSSGKAWALRFSTRSNEVVILNFNASQDTDSLPDGAALGGELESQYEQMIKFVKSLKLVPNG